MIAALFAASPSGGGRKLSSLTSVTMIYMVGVGNRHERRPSRPRTVDAPRVLTRDDDDGSVTAHFSWFFPLCSQLAESQVHRGFEQLGVLLARAIGVRDVSERRRLHIGDLTNRVTVIGNGTLGTASSAVRVTAGDRHEKAMEQAVSNLAGVRRRGVSIALLGDMTSERRRRRWSSDHGYTLLETLLVIGVLGVVSAMATMQIGKQREQAAADAGMRVILSQVNQARELAIAQRRYMQLVFIVPNLVQIVRENPGGTPATTTMSSALMEGNVRYTTSLPNTPDALPIGGTPAGWKDFRSDSTLQVDVKFSPDGTLVDPDGKTANGTVYLAIPGMTASWRAVTIQGSTGRVRGYRRIGNQWKLV